MRRELRVRVRLFAGSSPAAAVIVHTPCEQAPNACAEGAVSLSSIAETRGTRHFPKRFAGTPNGETPCPQNLQHSKRPPARPCRQSAARRRNPNSRALRVRWWTPCPRNSSRNSRRPSERDFRTRRERAERRPVGTENASILRGGRPLGRKVAVIGHNKVVHDGIRSASKGLIPLTFGGMIKSRPHSSRKTLR